MAQQHCARAVTVRAPWQHKQGVVATVFVSTHGGDRGLHLPRRVQCGRPNTVGICCGGHRVLHGGGGCEAHGQGREIEGGKVGGARRVRDACVRITFSTETRRPQKKTPLSCSPPPTPASRTHFVDRRVHVVFYSPARCLGSGGMRARAARNVDPRSRPRAVDAAAVHHHNLATTNLVVELCTRSCVCGFRL